MKEETLIDTKPKPKLKYHEATMTTNAYFSTNLASELRKDTSKSKIHSKNSVKK